MGIFFRSRFALAFFLKGRLSSFLEETNNGINKRQNVFKLHCLQAILRQNFCSRFALAWVTPSERSIISSVEPPKKIPSYGPVSKKKASNGSLRVIIIETKKDPLERRTRI